MYISVAQFLDIRKHAIEIYTNTLQPLYFDIVEACKAIHGESLG